MGGLVDNNTPVAKGTRNQEASSPVLGDVPPAEVYLFSVVFFSSFLNVIGPKSLSSCTLKYAMNISFF